MAQDVESDTPEAVIEISGIKTVDYKAATNKAVAARGVQEHDRIRLNLPFASQFLK